jgi:hypothetical protein
MSTAWKDALTAVAAMMLDAYPADPSDDGPDSERSLSGTGRHRR